MDEPVEAGAEGLADLATDMASGGAEVTGEVGEVAMVEVGFSVEAGDEDEVAFGVGEEFGEFGVAGEGGVFCVEDVVEL